MSVHNGFIIEIYGFTHLHTFLTCAADDVIAMEDSEDRRRHQGRERSRDIEDG